MIKRRGRIGRKDAGKQAGEFLRLGLRAPSARTRDAWGNRYKVIDAGNGKIIVKARRPTVTSACRVNMTFQVSTIPLWGEPIIVVAGYWGDCDGRVWRSAIPESYQSLDPEGNPVLVGGNQEWANRDEAVQLALNGSRELLIQLPAPIWFAPAIWAHPTGIGLLVLVATGGTVRNVLNNNGLYCIWYRPGYNPAAIDNLAQHVVSWTGDNPHPQTSGGLPRIRLVDATPINWLTHMGWFMEFTEGEYPSVGYVESIPGSATQRVPIGLGAAQAIWTTTEAGYWLYVLDTYGRGLQNVWDMNLDGLRNDDDKVFGEWPAAFGTDLPITL